MAEEVVQSRTLDYATLVGFMIASFDWLLTLDSEVKLIWTKEGVKIKLLYLLTRYVLLATSLPLLLFRFGNYIVPVCTTLYKIFASIAPLTSLFAELVFTIRTWAVWAREKRVTYLIFGMYAMTCISVLVCSGLSLSTASTTSSRLKGCFPAYQNSNILPISYVTQLVFDTADLVLIIVRGASLYWWGKDSRLFRSIYSDGIMFYVYMTVLSIANVALLFGQSDHFLILATTQPAIRSILACRCILHILIHIQEPIATEVLPTIRSGIHFSPPSRDEDTQITSPE